MQQPSSYLPISAAAKKKNRKEQTRAKASTRSLQSVATETQHVPELRPDRRWTNQPVQVNQTRSSRENCARGIPSSNRALGQVLPAPTGPLGSRSLADTQTQEGRG